MTAKGMSSTASLTRTRASPERCCYGEIALIVATTEGLYTQRTRGSGDVDLLHRIWRSLGSELVDMLTRTRSCVVPDFLHASCKVQQTRYFDGDRLFCKPQLVLLPDFCDKFGLQNVLVMRDAHYHATVPCNVYYNAIAAHVGTTRHVVEAAVRDSVREIGKYLHRNPDAVLTIDMGIGSLEFRGRCYRMHWDDAVLGALQASMGTAAQLQPPRTLPSMTVGGPTAPCRLQTGALTPATLTSALERTLDAEARVTVAEMHNRSGGSGYYKTTW